MRGFGRVYIKNKTGYEIGTGKSRFKDELKDIDKLDYRVMHLRNRYNIDQIKELFNIYAVDQDYDLNKLLFDLGLQSGNNKQFVSVKKIFCLIGLENEFVSAIKRRNTLETQNSIKRKYGDDIKCALQVPEVKKKAEETNLKKYGKTKPYLFGSQEFKQLMLDRYGAENSLTVPEIKEKLKNVNMQKYGVPWIVMWDQFSEKSKQTFIKHYGVETPGQSKEIQEARKKTMMEKYGVEYTAESPELYQKMLETYRQNYGNYSMGWSPENTAKRKTTMLERYGVEYSTQNETILHKIHETLKRNNTYSSSEAEKYLGELLKQYFGDDDVLSQYKSEEYPFRCDYYIRSRSLYIELNGSWTHGGHWFDSTNDEDLKKLQSWMDKNTQYYDAAINTWTERDPLKKRVAEENHLNYIVFWDSTNLEDVFLWFACDCPNSDKWEPYIEFYNSMI